MQLVQSKGFLNDSTGAEEMDLDESERSERKRQRERARRSELSCAFDDLGVVLSNLDPKSSPQGSGKKGKRDVDCTRLDKLHRTTALLKRMHRDMIAMQNKIRTLEQRKTAPGYASQEEEEPEDGDKEVIVMVPTLTLQQDVPLAHRSSSESQYVDVPPPASSYPPPAYAAPAPDPYAPLDANAPSPYHRSQQSEVYSSSETPAVSFRPLPFWQRAASPIPPGLYSTSYGPPRPFVGTSVFAAAHHPRERSLSRCDTPSSHGCEE